MNRLVHPALMIFQLAGCGVDVCLLTGLRGHVVMLSRPPTAPMLVSSQRRQDPRKVPSMVVRRT
jgi:hypothetical protein